MRVKPYDVLARCIEEGIAYGWNRAHKHTDTPSEDHVKEQMTTAILGEVSEYFDFGDGVE